MADKARLQIKTSGDPEAWSDVGSAGTNLPVSDIISNSLVPSQYDTIEINYTDSSKETIATVVFKLGTTTVSTLTLTEAATKNTWVKS